VHIVRKNPDLHNCCILIDHYVFRFQVAVHKCRSGDNLYVFQ
jgi:hypothetical protein